MFLGREEYMFYPQFNSASTNLLNNEKIGYGNNQNLT